MTGGFSSRPAVFHLNRGLFISTGSFSSRPAAFHLVFSNWCKRKIGPQHVCEPTRYRIGQRPSLLDLVLTNESHLVRNILMCEPLGKSDHMVLDFEEICYWTGKLATTKLLRNFSKANFSGLSAHLASTIHMNGPAEELYTLIQSAIHEADPKYIPRKPAKMKSMPSLPRRIRRLLDSRAHLFAKTTIDATP